MKRIDPRILQSLELQNQHETSKAATQPLIALDWGEKFCGLAWSPDGSVCLPAGVHPHAEITTAINKIITEKKPSKIIVGLPISGDGGENHICALIREFVKKEITIPFEFCNERGSSQATLSPAKNERIDDLAAAHILERYLRQESFK